MTVYNTMGSVTFFMLILIFFFIFILKRSEQGSSTPIVDSKTGKELKLLTQTYYAIQNQNTLRYLIWFGKNGTIDSDLDETQGQFWHIFERIEGGWYKMSHHFGSHNVKIAKSHQQGYYHIYNKDCFNGEHPNGDADDRGTIKCFIVENGSMTEFNWRFLEKLESKKEHSRKNSFDNNYIILFVGMFCLIFGTLFVILRSNFKNYISSSNRPQEVVYSQDNQGFRAASVFPPVPDRLLGFEKI